MSNEPPPDAHNALLPDVFHLPVGRPVTHKIYRDAAHPSRFVLPFTKRTAVENRQPTKAFVGPSNPPHPDSGLDCRTGNLVRGTQRLSSRTSGC
ncbi:hypothetical protein [Microbispora sp. GKU 823]|uniref:hypothetical protein n=1 Tax=Microbispora sp. GKU 823 TaxID=1652100 RepID=UPI001C4DF6A2|nr:hypothetical protein [Microbispora sp. GKU 823]